LGKVAVAVADSSRNLQASTSPLAAALSISLLFCLFSGIGELHMLTRRAPAIPANYNFARAYFELKKLREDVECMERLAGLTSVQATEANVDKPKSS
jgi:hypothetical protein